MPVGVKRKEGKMKELKLLLAAFLGIFIVFSPVVNNLSLLEKLAPGPGITSTPLPEVKPQSIVGEQAPDLKMKLMNGKEVELRDFRGRTVVLYFWSTWCPTCWKGMWFMNELYTKNENPKLLVLAANAGFRDRNAEIQRFVNRRNLRLPVTICTTDAMAKYKIQGIPTVFIVDGQGKIRHQEMGAIKEQEFKAKLKRILKEPQYNQQPAIAN